MRSTWVQSSSQGARWPRGGKVIKKDMWSAMEYARAGVKEDYSVPLPFTTSAGTNFVNPKSQNRGYFQFVWITQFFQHRILSPFLHLLALCWSWRKKIVIFPSLPQRNFLKYVWFYNQTSETVQILCKLFCLPITVSVIFESDQFYTDFIISPGSYSLGNID